MRYRLILILISISTIFGINIHAEEQNDTIYNPSVIFTGMPKKYEIAGIRVSGLQNYEDYIVIGYSGLAVGDVIEIPGEDITKPTAAHIANQLPRSEKRRAGRH